MRKSLTHFETVPLTTVMRIAVPLLTKKRSAKHHKSVVGASVVKPRVRLHQRRGKGV
jgi:hypothetical protein